MAAKPFLAMLLLVVSLVSAMPSPTKPSIADVILQGFGLIDSKDTSSYTTSGPIPTPSMTNSSSNDVMWQLSKDNEFAFQLAGVLSLADAGGSASGEVLRAAAQIIPGSYESYYKEFKYLADTLFAMGKKTTQKVSIRNAMFHAATYYRSADFFLHGNQSDPRIYSLWASQTEAFDTALAHMDIPGVRYNVSTPYGFYSPIIFYKADKDPNKKLPTFITGTGYDGAQEDLYHMNCAEVLRRGWNCVTYEGPGQPTVRRYQRLGFIRDWWQVVTPVLDHILTRSDVDPDNMVLFGVSFGGGLAPLAATHEHRFKAIICSDGIWDIGKVTESQFPQEVQALFKEKNQTAYDNLVNEIRLSPNTPTSVRWFIDQSLWAFNTTSPYDWMTRLLQFGLENVTQAITTPVFVGSGQDDDKSAGEPEALANALGKRATYHLFKTETGAGEHCQAGAVNQFAQAAFDWFANMK